jgi:regulator of replication initiation timing
MFKTLTEMRTQLIEIEGIARKQSNTLFNLTWENQGLRREVRDLRTWNTKVRTKNSALRKERRRLRALLDEHGISWS